ncbi:MAG TPA: ATP-binding protein [Acidimicrobiales bacterium]|nr:ATP-binding protein [Acidimicrobiales bacterium]
MGLDGHGEVDLGVDVVARTDAVPAVRHLLACWLRDLQADRRLIDDMVLVVTELVTNAIEASTEDGSRVGVSAAAADHTIEIEVTDDGGGFELGPAVGLPGPRSSRGRGLGIVNALCDHVEVRRDRGRTVVRACRRAG